MFLTIFHLYVEAGKHARNHEDSQWKIFKTLLLLYFKSKFFKDNEKILQKVNNFSVYSYDYPTLIELYREIFLNKIYKPTLIRENPLIIDCGANIGMSVLFFKKLYPKSEILAFEANPSSFSLLELNMEANNITGVQLFNCALNDRKEPINFYVPDHRGSLNASSIKGYNNGKKISVQGQKLSDFLNNKKIDILKIDIEGAENKVIEDLVHHNILNSVDEIIIEYHYQITGSATQLKDFLLSFENFNLLKQCSYPESIDVKNSNVILHFKNKKF